MRKFNFLNNLSIKQAIGLSFIFIISLSLLFNALSYEYIAKKDSKGKFENIHRGIKARVFTELEKYYSETDEIVNFNINLARENYLNTNNKRDVQNFFFHQINLKPYFSFLYFIDNDLNYIGVYQHEKYVLYGNGKDDSVDWYSKDGDNPIKLSNIRIKFINNVPLEGVMKGPFYNKENNETFMFYEKGYIYGKEKRGFFGVGLNIKYLSEFLKKIINSNNIIVYIANEKGEIIASSIDNGKDKLRKISDSNIESVFKETYKSDSRENQLLISKNFYYTINGYTLSESHQWKVYTLISNEIIKKEKRDLYNTIFLTSILSFSLSFFVSILLSKWILNPLKTVSKEFLVISKGKWGHKISNSRSDILGEIINAFNLMSEKLDEYFKRLNEKNKELQKINENLKVLVEERTHELKKLSYTDDLTKLKNRRFITKKLDYYIELMKSEEFFLSICVIDVDYFKRINDNYGHIKGDEVLKGLAKLLSEFFRGKGVVGRLGGEEFLVILPDKDLEESYRIVEEFRILVERDNKSEVKYTVSCGVASYEKEFSIEAFIDKADKKLYEAKNSGRNCSKK